MNKRFSVPSSDPNINLRSNNVPWPYLFPGERSARNKVLPLSSQQSDISERKSVKQMLLMGAMMPYRVLRSLIGLRFIQTLGLFLETSYYCNTYL